MNQNGISAVLIAILGASLLGSAHCAAMCGGLVISVCHSSKSILFYHLGRLIGYASLGLAAGFLGQHIFQSQVFMIIPWLSSAILGLTYIFIGITIFVQRPIYLFHLPRNGLSVLNKFRANSPFRTGLISAFLPCGWLHTFILGALATHNPWLGTAQLFLFWLGTLPALSFFPFISSQILKPIFEKAPRISGFLLICIGLLSLSLKVITHRHGENRSCHKHHYNRQL